MLECISCGANYEVSAADKIFHFRYMPELVCLYSTCPTCGHPFLQYYGEQDELLAVHMESGVKVISFPVPTESMIEAFRALYKLPSLDPRELDEQDEIAVLKFVGELESENRTAEVLDDWNEE